MKAVRYVVPNLFTALAFCLGLWSVFLSHGGELERAGWLIVWCALLDIADGAAARLLKATSPFGAQFDSLADVVAFGIAPAVLAYQAAGSFFGVATGSPTRQWIAAACVFFALMAALRLARFNVTEPERQAKWFRGIPTTLAGSIVATAIVVAARGLPADHAVGVTILPAALLALGLAMISTLRFPKIAKRGSSAVNAFQVVLLVAVYACGALRVAPEFLLAVAASFALLGILAGLLAGDAGR